MHIHRYERWWLTFGIAMLFVFLGTIAFAAFADDINPPSGLQAIDPVLKRLARGNEQPFPLLRFEFARSGDGR